MPARAQGTGTAQQHQVPRLAGSRRAPHQLIAVRLPTPAVAEAAAAAALTAHVAPHPMVDVLVASEAAQILL